MAIGCFLILAQKNPNQAFLVPNLWIFVEFPDFKYGNRVFFNYCPKISKSGIFSPKFMNFCWIPWFQIWQYCFQIPAKKYPNKAFLSPKFKHFCWRCWFQMWQYCLQVPGQKHPNEAFFVKNTQYSIIDPRFRHLWFSGIFSIREIWRRGFQQWQYCI